MNVLIAEDDPVSREILRADLEILNYDVEFCETGQEAWNVLQRHSVDILISDWMMPEMDGLELCRRVRSRETENYVYVILLTAKCRREDRFEGFRAGADDFLSKPLDPDELEARLFVAQRILAMQARLVESNNYLKDLATTDALTGLHNHRALQERLGYEFQRSQRYHADLSMVMLDVDHFKQFNDSFGHPAGDRVLQQVAAVLRSSARATDYVARYGGEEFAIILPETRPAEATEAAERIRSEVADIFHLPRPITISAGISTMRADTDSQAVLLQEADRALYASKTRGRNCVTHFAALEGDLTP
jgi:diguanylate cyclase (GGDEF)-like protein